MWQKRVLGQRSSGPPEYLRAMSEVVGTPTTFSVGVASLTEHVVRSADDLLAKSERALRAAQERAEGSVMKGFASVAVYDFRTMPLDDEDEED